AVCASVSRIVVDAVDSAGEAGGVAWSVGTSPLSVLRLSGGDNVFRGLVLKGTRGLSPPRQLDTLVITGGTAQRNRIEQCVILGPTSGDGVSVDHDAGQPEGLGDNVIAASRIACAKDRGIKVDYGGVVTIEQSCVHD